MKSPHDAKHLALGVGAVAIIAIVILFAPKGGANIQGGVIGDALMQRVLLFYKAIQASQSSQSSEPQYCCGDLAFIGTGEVEARAPDTSTACRAAAYSDD